MTDLQQLVQDYLSTLAPRGARGGRTAQVRVAAERFGVSETTVWYWFAGHRRPTPEKIVAMARELGDGRRALGLIGGETDWGPPAQVKVPLVAGRRRAAGG